MSKEELHLQVHNLNMVCGGATQIDGAIYCYHSPGATLVLCREFVSGDMNPASLWCQIACSRRRGNGNGVNNNPQPHYRGAIKRDPPRKRW